MTVFIPEFDALFAEFGMQLPAVTRAVFSVGRHPVALLVAPAAVAAGGGRGSGPCTASRFSVP